MVERVGRDGGRRHETPEALAEAPTPTEPAHHALRTVPAWAAVVQPDLSGVREVVGHDRGSPLDPDLRAEMEGRLESDFSDVRIHVDQRAAASAASVRARAYTVGNEIVFGQGAFDPVGASGRRRLAHELVHVVQQRANLVTGAPPGDGVAVSDPSDPLERQAAAAADSSLTALRRPEDPRGGGGPSPRTFGPGEATTHRPPGRGPASPHGPSGPRRRGPVGAGLVVQREAEDKPASHPQLALGSTGPDVETLQRRLNVQGATPPLVEDGQFSAPTESAVREFQGLHGLAVDGIVGIRMWGILDELDTHSIVGPTATDVSSTAAVSQTQHNDIETILHPGGVGPGNTIPAMDGKGVGGAYETEMITALDQVATDNLSGLPASPGTTMAHADRIGAAAQAAAEDFFGSSIALASRRPRGDWHPGSSKQGLRDATTRPVDNQDILGWSEYFMDNGSYPPAGVNLAHHFDNSRPADRAEHDRVRDVWLNAHGGSNKVRQMIRSWPAEAGTGRVFVQLRQYHDRDGMWQLFGTLLHEFQHLATHPNYVHAADAIGGEGRAILIEGMAEHMRFQVWPHVLATLPANTALRQTVEGPFFQSPANAADYAVGGPVDTAASSGVYDERAQADDIAANVSETNVRAAFFMGHMEAIGLGQGSKTATPFAAGVATWRPGGNGEPNVYVVGAAGERLSDIQTRTGGVNITEVSGTALNDPTVVFPAGHRLLVPGLHWHTTIPEDTRGQVANQNGITVARLEQANSLPAGQETTPFLPGTVLLIPVR